VIDRAPVAGGLKEEEVEQPEPASAE